MGCAAPAKVLAERIGKKLRNQLQTYSFVGFFTSEKGVD